MSNQYAFIPLAELAELNQPENYPVRIPKYLQGYNPDELDSNGTGIPNVLELEASEFSQSQLDEITLLDGQFFDSATEYLNFQQNLINS